MTALVSHYIEDLTVGQSATYSRTVTEADIQQFGAVSGDMNPLHFDEDYAKTTIFRGRIAHGMLSLSYLSTVLGTQLPRALKRTVALKKIEPAPGSWVPNTVER